VPVAVVTGGSAGVGRAAARAFADRGYDVTVLARGEERLDATRRELEALVHPAVRRAMEAGLRTFERLGGAEFAVVAIPLLYETGTAGEFTAVVATTCRVGQQLERLAARGLTPVEARQRVEAQLPAGEKAARAEREKREAIERVIRESADAAERKAETLAHEAGQRALAAARTRRAWACARCGRDWR